MSSVQARHLTADELFAMGDIGRCELIYGELVMMSPAGFGHGEVALRISSFLREFFDANNLGTVVGAETGYAIAKDLVRAPDASFVRKDRLPAASIETFFPGVPDLAVEVISPGDTKREVTDKTNMWLANGTAVVWVVDPKLMVFTVFRVGEKPERLSAADNISNEPLLPGFNLPLSKVFKRP